MRITNDMITNTESFNEHRAIARFLDMQSQMSSGKGINNSSDLTKVLTELAIFENDRPATYMASAKNVQPILLDYIK